MISRKDELIRDINSRLEEIREIESTVEGSFVAARSYIREIRSEVQAMRRELNQIYMAERD